MRDFNEVCEQSFRFGLITEKQANNSCEYVSDMQAGNYKNIKEKRKQAAYKYSVLDQKKV